MGRIFRNIGVLASGHVEETTAKQLTGAHIGETKDKVNAAMEAAAGGILFIDEAYSLTDNQYGRSGDHTVAVVDRFTPQQR